MGLFDTVICHYKPLGDEFMGVELQTKSLDSSMSNYWITPAGELFMIDLADSMEIVNVVVDSPGSMLRAGRQTGKVGAFPFKWRATGKHKKLTPVYYTGKMIVYPAQYSGDYEDWPEATLLFKHGKTIYHKTTKPL